VKALTTAQYDALRSLANNFDLWQKRGHPESERFTLPVGARPSTLEALERRGLVKCNYTMHGYCRAQITSAGYEVARPSL